MQSVRTKFATQVDEQLLASIKDLARSEGRQIQSIVEEALQDLLSARQNQKARGRDHVMKAYLKSVDRYSGLYKKLAE